MLMVMATSILCIQLALEQDNLVPPLELLKSEDMHMIDAEAEDDPMRMWALALQVASTVIGAADIREAGWWVRERSTIWYDYFLVSAYEDFRWRNFMGMPRRVFYWMVSEVADILQRQVTRFRKPVPVEIRVGACLHRLVSGHTYFHVGDRFGLGESTVQELMEEVIQAIITVFGPGYLKWPTGDDLKAVSDGFQRRAGLPNCVGAIDGSHIRIRSPTSREQAIDFYNRKGYHSIVLQAVTDCDGCFLDVSCGLPGSANDKRVLRFSSLFQRVQAGCILQEPVVSINAGFQLKPYLLGDGGYAMERWLMIPYHIVPSSPDLHVLYNARHTAGRICVEQAFGLLKGRFSLLEKGIGSSVRWAAKVVHACCILQNILIKNRVGRLDFDAVGFRASGSSALGVNHARPGDSGGEVRTALAEYVALTPWEG